MPNIDPYPRDGSDFVTLFITPSGVVSFWDGEEDSQGRLTYTKQLESAARFPSEFKPEAEITALLSRTFQSRKKANDHYNNLITTGHIMHVKFHKVPAMLEFLSDQGKELSA